MKGDAEFGRIGGGRGGDVKGTMGRGSSCRGGRRTG